MRRFRNQTARIAYYEELFDRISDALRVLREQGDARALDALCPGIDELTAYYGGRAWKKDYADDEAGRLPPSLKRGVLSQDGVYDLLEEIEELSKKRRNDMEEQTITITVKTRGEKCEMSDEEIRAWYETHIAKLFDPAYGTPEITVKVDRKNY